MQILQLSDKKTIKQLVEVDTNESILELINKELSKKEYNFVITADDIPKAKKIMAELNKSKDFIDTFRKTKVSDESLDIDLFKDNMKSYTALIDTKREEIKKKFEVFEKETKDKILKELSLYCEEYIKSQGIRDNFKDVNIIDLILASSVTPKGALTKKARETIESRVNVCKSKQDKYDMRLMQLENESYKAGLASPLTITHIQGIISLDSDEEYQTKLNELISSEIARQETIKANIQKQANETAQRDAHQEVLVAQNRINSIFNGIATDNSLSLDEKIEKVSNYDCTQFAQLESFARTKSQSVVSELNNFKDTLKDVHVEVKEPIVHQVVQERQEPKIVSNGKEIIKIKAMFEITVPLGANRGKVINILNKKLSDAGITSDSLKSLEVV